MLVPRAFTVLSVLNDVKEGFTTLLGKPNKHPALLMIYARSSTPMQRSRIGVQS
jgi:hypothetical protein